MLSKIRIIYEVRYHKWLLDRLYRCGVSDICFYSGAECKRFCSEDNQAVLEFSGTFKGFDLDDNLFYFNRSCGRSYCHCSLTGIRSVTQLREV